MPSCNEIIDNLLKENLDLTDKEIIAKMKVLKDTKGKRLYKTSTIASKLRQFRAKQRVLPELSELEKVSLDDAKKEVEEAFGRRDDMNKELKNIEPQEMESGHKLYDGRQKEPCHQKHGCIAIEEKVDALVNNGNNKKPQEMDLNSVLNNIMECVEKLDKRIDVMQKKILQLMNQKELPVAVTELVDIQLMKSTVDMLDDLNTDDVQDLNEIIRHLVEQKDEIRMGVPDFLEKIQLDKDETVHGKLFMHGSKWRFAKRLKPIIYGIIGAGVGGLSLFILLVLLRTLGVLPGWI